MYTAQLGNLHPLIVGFLAAGAVSAAFSTVSGLLVAGASAFSHDLYVKVINPKASPKKQLLFARLGTILMSIIVGAIAMAKLALIAQLVAVAFSLAGCTIFPLFLLGKLRIDHSIIALSYFIAGKMGLSWPMHEFMDYWLGAWYFAWIGAPLAIFANIIVSKFTKETPIEIRKFLIENVHS